MHPNATKKLKISRGRTPEPSVVEEGNIPSSNLLALDGSCANAHDPRRYRRLRRLFADAFGVCMQPPSAAYLQSPLAIVLYEYVSRMAYTKSWQPCIMLTGMHIWVTNEDVNWNILKKALCLCYFLCVGC